MYEEALYLFLLIFVFTSYVINKNKSLFLSLFRSEVCVCSMFDSLIICTVETSH